MSIAAVAIGSSDTPRRIAWLLAHKTLRATEVPILQSLGFEVWTLKRLPGQGKGADFYNFRSGNVDPGLDSISSLSPDALSRLDGHDFYTDPIPDDIARDLNSHFEMVITDCFPDKVEELLSKFHGKIVVRVFGRENPETYLRMFDRKVIAAVRRNYDQFWFSAAYPQVLDHEPAFFKARGVFLPVGLPAKVLASPTLWRGEERKVLFVCPSINSSPYYGTIYARFKERFGGLPHVVAGNQLTSVPDPSVIGFLPDADYLRLFESSVVMYYHSREPRHLHYHPLEAIAYGMPVVYRTGGLLGFYDTGNRAGACDTEDEAYDKLSRVLAGDQGLVEAIRSGQRAILDPFRPEVVREAWRSWLAAFEPGADGRVPATTLWPNIPPRPTVAEKAEYPNLRPMPPAMVRRLAFAVGRSRARMAGALRRMFG